MVLDISQYAGFEIAIRFRFESDGAYSSQDQYNNPPNNSVLDGAWQLDNIALYDVWPDEYDDPFDPTDFQDEEPPRLTGSYVR